MYNPVTEATRKIRVADQWLAYAENRRLDPPEPATQPVTPPKNSHVFMCSECGGSILEGDVYLDLLGEQFCITCLSKHFHFAIKSDEAE